MPTKEILELDPADSIDFSESIEIQTAAGDSYRIPLAWVQTSSFNVGDVLYSYSPTAKEGFIRFGFDNEVLKTAFPELYAIVGDSFEAEHTAAGESLTSSLYFWPTPIPGGYSRAAVSLDIEVSSVDSGTERMTIPTADYDRLEALRGSGLPIKLTLVSGTLTGGLTAETEYFIGFISSGVISFYASEANAISDTSPVDLTDTNVGTYTFHQTGLLLDDAFQEHQKQVLINGDFIKRSDASGGSDGSNSGLRHSGSGNDEGLAGLSSTYGNYGTPRISNETRPKTNYQYAYIKAVNIDLTSGQSITALKYSTGWVSLTDWTDAHETITHNLNAYLGDLIVEMCLSPDGTDANSVKTIDTNYTNVSGSLCLGIQFDTIDENSFDFHTGNIGVTLINSSGNDVLLQGSDTYYYKIVLRKEQFVTKVYEPKYFYYDLTSSSATHNLPDASTYIGELTIECENGTYGTNNLTLNPVGSQTIDGYSSYVIELKNTVTLISNGSGWRITYIKIPLIIELAYVVSSGTDGGGATATSWLKRPINDLLDTNVPGVTLGSSVINIPAGEYEVIEGWGVFKDTGLSMNRLYNTSDSATLSAGASIADTSGSNVTALSHLKGKRFSITSAKNVEFQYWCASAKSTNGLGWGVTSGEEETHSYVKIRKIA